MNRVIISGATGVLGFELAKMILRELRDIEIVCLYRKSDPRLETLKLSAANGNTIKLLSCNLSASASIDFISRSLSRVDECLGIHCAADVAWNKTLDEVIPINVHGSIHFCEILRRTSKSPKAIYLSSAYTSTQNWEYRNTYEESKAMGEIEIKKRFPGLPISVFSCSLVIGNSNTGVIGRFHGIYPLLKFATLFDVPFFVGRKNCLIDLVPVDWTIEQLFAMVKRVITGENNEDVVAVVGERRIPLAELAEIIYKRINKHRSEMGVPDKPVPPILSYRQWLFIQRTVKIWDVKGLPPRKFKYFEELLESYKHYIDNDKVLPPFNITCHAPDPRSYFDIIIDYWFNTNKELISKRWQV